MIRVVMKFFVLEMFASLAMLLQRLRARREELVCACCRSLFSANESEGVHFELCADCFAADRPHELFEFGGEA